MDYPATLQCAKLFHFSRVLVKCCTKEILCACRFLKIRGNIDPILCVLYRPKANAENNRCTWLHPSCTATQIIHSFSSSFQSGCVASNRLKLNPSKSEFLWCNTLLRRRLLDYSTFALGDTEVQPADTTTTLESTLTAVWLWRFMWVNSFEAVSISWVGLKQSDVNRHHLGQQHHCLQAWLLQ